MEMQLGGAVGESVLKLVFQSPVSRWVMNFSITSTNLTVWIMQNITCVETVC